MPKTLGNAVAGTSYTDHTPDLPRAGTTLGHGHRPWCVDCKRKHNPDQLDDDQRCPRCARAAITRTLAAERRAQDTEAQRVWAEAAKGPSARRKTTPTKPRRPAGAPKQLQQVLDDLEAPDPAVAAAAASYDDMVDRVTRPGDHLQAPTAEDPALAPIRVARATLVRNLDATAKAIVDLDRLIQTLTPAPQPAPAAAERPTRRRAPSSHARPVDEQAIVTDYQTGASAPQIAAKHRIGAKRVRSILDRHGIERRDDRAGHSGGHNKAPVVDDPALRDDVVRRYTAGESTITLAADHDCSAKLINAVLRRAGIERRPSAHIGRPITDDDIRHATTAYAAGESLMAIAKDLGLKKDRIRRVLLDQGVTIRPRGASHTNQQHLQQLGVTTNQVKTWALEQGLVDRIAKGLVAGHLIEAYAAAHPTDLEAAS